MYTKEEIIRLLQSARYKLHKQENGQEVTSMDITLAHDQIDMVLDAITQKNVDVSSFLT